MCSAAAAPLPRPPPDPLLTNSLPLATPLFLCFLLLYKLYKLADHENTKVILSKTSLAMH